MGEGEPASEGLVDYTYLPAWDTWFAVIQTTDDLMLLSWIPDELTPLIQGAIEVSAHCCLGWLDEMVSGKEWLPYLAYSFPYDSRDGISKAIRTALAEVLAALQQ